MSKRLFVVAMLIAVVAGFAIVGQAFARDFPYNLEVTPNPDVQCSGAMSNEYFTSFLANTSGQTIYFRRYWKDGNGQKTYVDDTNGWPLSSGTSATFSLVKQWPTNIVTEGWDLDTNPALGISISYWSDRCRY